MSRAVFLPGAGGLESFWLPAAGLIDPSIDSYVFGWPGFGDRPRDESISSLTDLVPYVVSKLTEPSTLIAQSMGGVVALMIALQYPQLVSGLVLCGTSGGVDVSRFGGEDWRGEAGAEDTPRWFIDDRSDLTDQIPSITAPALLIWGDDDRISPPAVGEYLASLFVNSQLLATRGGHDHPMRYPGAVATLINDFLRDNSLRPAPNGTVRA